METNPQKKTDATPKAPAVPVTITISKNVDVSIPTVVCSSDSLSAGSYRLFDLYTDAAKLRATCAKAGKKAKQYNTCKNWLSTLLYWFFKTGMLAIQAAVETGNPNAKPELILSDLSEMIGVAYAKALKETNSPAEASDKSTEAPVKPAEAPPTSTALHKGKYEK